MLPKQNCWTFLYSNLEGSVNCWFIEAHFYSS
jgi:hypothetical protein